MSHRFTISSQTIHRKVGRMEAFYDLSPLVAFYSFTPHLPWYVCATRTHSHARPHRHREPQEFVKSCTALSLIHTIQKPAASQCGFSFFFMLNIYETLKPEADWLIQKLKEWYQVPDLNSLPKKLHLHLSILLIHQYPSVWKVKHLLRSW